jgi:hypothetical protein
LPTLGRPTIPTCKTPAPQMEITSFEDHCSFPSQSNAAASRASNRPRKSPETAPLRYASATRRCLQDEDVTLTQKSLCAKKVRFVHVHSLLSNNSTCSPNCPQQHTEQHLEPAGKLSEGPRTKPLDNFFFLGRHELRSQ